MAAQPCNTLSLRYRLEAAAHGVIAHDARQAEQLGQHAVGAQGRHVRVALVAGQHRQHCRAEHVALVRRIGARVVQWAVGNQGVEHPGRLEKLDEERRLAKRRKWCLGIPLHMHPTGPAVQRHALGPGLPINRGLPTPTVSGNIALCRAHAPDNEPNSSSRKPIKLPDLGSSSTKWRYTLASSGLITCPCPVPVSLSSRRPSSMTPTLMNFRISLRMLASLIRPSIISMSCSRTIESK